MMTLATAATARILALSSHHPCYRVTWPSTSASEFSYKFFILKPLSWKGKPYWITSTAVLQRLGELQLFLWYLEAIDIYSSKVGFLSGPFVWTSESLGFNPFTRRVFDSGGMQSNIAMTGHPVLTYLRRIPRPVANDGSLCKGCHVIP